VKISLERSGGFTGISSKVTLDTQELDPAERAELETLVNKSGFFQMPEKIDSPGLGADRFAYRLTVEDAGRSHTVEAVEGSIPEALQPLIVRLNQLGRRSRG